MAQQCAYYSLDSPGNTLPVPQRQRTACQTVHRQLRQPRLDVYCAREAAESGRAAGDHRGPGEGGAVALDASRLEERDNRRDCRGARGHRARLAISFDA